MRWDFRIEWLGILTIDLNRGLKNCVEVDELIDLFKRFYAEFDKIWASLASLQYLIGRVGQCVSSSNFVFVLTCSKMYTTVIHLPKLRCTLRFTPLHHGRR